MKNLLNKKLGTYGFLLIFQQEQVCKHDIWRKVEVTKLMHSM